MPTSEQRKLVKPSPDFPLTPQPNGYWSKKINKKRHYFGPRWCEPEAALADYESRKDELAGAPKPAKKSAPKAKGADARLARHKKPSADFPLTPHKSGYWCKSIRGKTHYFGGKWCSPQEALQEYLKVKDDLLAGREPNQVTEGLTVEQGVNLFMADREYLRDHGKLTPVRFEKYLGCCRRVAKVFGKRCLIEHLRASDFTRLMRSLEADFSPVTIGDNVTMVKSLFRFLEQSGELQRGVLFGPRFKKPTQQEVRRYRATKPSRELSAHEIRSILTHASAKMHAMVLLGINCGLGNGDLSELTTPLLQREKGWLVFPRPKTGVERRCPLWPETQDAIASVLANRPSPKLNEHEDLLFLSVRGGPFQRPNNSNISSEFKKLMTKAGIERKGVGFYALRHMTATVGSRSLDSDAVDLIMGHADNSVRSGYVEWTDDQRLKKVTDCIHEWLWPHQPPS